MRIASLAAVFVPLAVFSQAAAAQRPAKQPTEEEKTVKITLHPMPETRPALKYQLLPPLLDRRPGNAAVWWNRLPAEQTGFLGELYKEGGLWEKIEKWMEIPVGDPQEKEYRAKEPEVANLASNHHGLFSDMEYAARFESCDWELPIREGNYFAMRIPEVQQSRTWGRLLSAKVRLQIAEGDYDQAVRTFQTGFALARHDAQGQTLIHGLIGATIGWMMTNQIEQFIQQPDAPNLYWALTTLPRPLVDFRPGFEAEMNCLYLTIPELKKLKEPQGKDLSAEQWRKILFETMTIVGGLGPWNPDRESPSSTLSVGTAALAIQGYPAAKQYLMEHGYPAAEVEAMPIAKAVLLHAVLLYEELRDDHFKWMFLPYPQFQKGYARADTNLKQLTNRREAGIYLAAILLPAVGPAKNAETRMQWYLAHLQIFEALRMYAAAHDGKLPDRLSDISEVPLPVNPFEDKPFLYQRDGNRATLTNEHGPPGVPWRYEITMLPKGD